MSDRMEDNKSVYRLSETTRWPGDRRGQDYTPHHLQAPMGVEAL